jgi:hypothetical protein
MLYASTKDLAGYLSYRTYLWRWRQDKLGGFFGRPGVERLVLVTLSVWEVVQVTCVFHRIVTPFLLREFGTSTSIDSLLCEYRVVLGHGG